MLEGMAGGGEYLYGWLQSRLMTERSLIFRSFHPRSTDEFLTREEISHIPLMAV